MTNARVLEKDTSRKRFGAVAVTKNNTATAVETKLRVYWGSDHLGGGGKKKRLCSAAQAKIFAPSVDERYLPLIKEMGVPFREGKQFCGERTGERFKTDYCCGSPKTRHREL